MRKSQIRAKDATRKNSVGGKIFLAFFFVFFVLETFTLMYAFFWCVSNSLKGNLEYLDSAFRLPRQLLLGNYVRAFQEVVINGNRLYVLYFNSIWMSSLHVSVSIASSTLAAYALAKFRFPGKSVIFSIAILVQILPIIGTGPALYKFLHKFGIANNPALIWLIWAGGFDFMFIVLYGYFKSISNSYAEAAYMDGAGHIKTMIRVMLPQAAPAIMALMVLNLIGAWNDYGTSLLYMRGYPNLALGIFLFEQESQFASIGTPILLANIMIAVLPLLVLFVVCQKMIMTNVTAGGLKG
ncbi:MAG: carbohydrate ABC transporter permease [Firmicutes bacterium]|nr:carbohydrate ABC transporter permease [Bacillota bacterium]